jgi:hypothetical protein
MRARRLRTCYLGAIEDVSIPAIGTRLLPFSRQPPSRFFYPSWLFTPKLAVPDSSQDPGALWALGLAARAASSVFVATPSWAPAVEEVSCLVFFDSAIVITNALSSRELTVMNIYVGNLPYSITDADLRETFSQYGSVDQVNLITDKFSGESKGFGFVEMNSNSEADAAIKALNGTDLKGRNITVNQAKPRAERSSRSGGGGDRRW